MCNWIVLFLLLCSGGGGCNGSGRSGLGCGCNGNVRNTSDCGCNGSVRNASDCGCGGNSNEGCGCGGSDNRDWDYDRNRGQNTPPPWIRSNYSNGDTCGCEEQ